MGKARDYIPALRYGNRLYPEDLAVGNPWANYWYVDRDNGSDSANNGSSADKPTQTIQQAVTNAGRGDVIFVRARAMDTGATDPVSYTENIVIPADKDGLSIIGIDTGRTQGGLPQLKVGTTTTQALLTVRAPGCYIANLGFNGAGATGGGILLDDDGSTKTAFGTTIENCHFKNCKGTTATNAATGGAIQLSGAPWQVLIQHNRFNKNVGGIVLLDTSNSVPQDVVIQYNSFASEAASTDVDIYGAGGSGFGVGLTIFGNSFEELPALGSATTARWMDLTGGDGGIVAGNYFGEDLTHGASGTGSFIPTTINVSGNYDAGGHATTS